MHCGHTLFWTVDQAHNWRNDRSMVIGPPESIPLMRTKHLAFIIMLGVIESNGRMRLSPYYYFKVGLKEMMDV